MINVTKPFLPEIKKYIKYIEKIWERNWLTNYGPLVNELEVELKKYLEVEYIQYTTNGTVPLQIALKVLKIKGEVITTPFSYVATTNAIIWENCMPIFVDIEPNTFCVDADKIESSVTERTTAILVTHVYGFPCNVLKIEQIANKYNLKVIYDGAHAFGVKINGKSIFSFGDISTCSFHATKLFHTVEGGAIICNDHVLNEKIFLHKAFGHTGEIHETIGINGKNSEFHAAMGLCNLPKIDEFILRRKEIINQYTLLLSSLPITFPKIPQNIEYNYSYCPVLFNGESELLMVKTFLESKQVFTRRYFFPSLNKLSYLESTSKCPISEDISKRVLCLPIYQELTNKEVSFICDLVKIAFEK